MCNGLDCGFKGTARKGCESFEKLTLAKSSADKSTVLVPCSTIFRFVFDTIVYKLAVAKAEGLHAVCDRYDAIRTEREYKPARTHKEAIEEIVKASDSQFDPKVVEAFCTIEKQIQETYEILAEEQNLATQIESEVELVVARG